MESIKSISVARIYFLASGLLPLGYWILSQEEKHSSIFEHDHSQSISLVEAQQQELLGKPLVLYTNKAFLASFENYP
jgi:hypothetical protein